MIGKAILVHGIFSSGENSVGVLGPLIAARDWEPLTFKYWPNDLVAARFLNGKRAREVKELAEREGATVAVGHSNGCAILHEAARKGATFERLIYVNPALDSKPKELPANVARIYVLHAPDDMATWMAKFLLAHPWGDMGRNGYKGPDERWVNLNMGEGKVWSPWRREHGSRDAPVGAYCGENCSAHGHGGAWHKKFWTELLADLAVGRLVVA